MSEEMNKALLRRFVEELVNQGNMAVAPELVAPDFLELDPFPGQAPDGQVSLRALRGCVQLSPT